MYGAVQTGNDLRLLLLARRVGWFGRAGDGMGWDGIRWFHAGAGLDLGGLEVGGFVASGMK